MHKGTPICIQCSALVLFFQKNNWRRSQNRATRDTPYMVNPEVTQDLRATDLIQRTQSNQEGPALQFLPYSSCFGFFHISKKTSPKSNRPYPQSYFSIQTVTNSFFILFLLKPFFPIFLNHQHIPFSKLPRNVRVYGEKKNHCQQLLYHSTTKLVRLFGKS